MAGPQPSNHTPFDKGLLGMAKISTPNTQNNTESILDFQSPPPSKANQDKFTNRVSQEKPTLGGIYVAGKICGVDALFCVDTGSTRTIVSTSLFQKIPKFCRPSLGTSRTLCKVDGRPFWSDGKGVFNIQLGCRKIQREWTVAEITNNDVVLGLDFLQADHDGPVDLILTEQCLVWSGCTILLITNSTPITATRQTNSVCRDDTLSFDTAQPFFKAEGGVTSSCDARRISMIPVALSTPCDVDSRDRAQGAGHVSHNFPALCNEKISDKGFDDQLDTDQLCVPSYKYQKIETETEMSSTVSPRTGVIIQSLDQDKCHTSVGKCSTICFWWIILSWVSTVNEYLFKIGTSIVQVEGTSHENGAFQSALPCKLLISFGRRRKTSVTAVRNDITRFTRKLIIHQCITIKTNPPPPLNRHICQSDSYVRYL